MTDSIVQVKGLAKLYGDVLAVENVSFAVRAGEIFGILGPNGAGKTTTLEIIEGLRQADAGTVTVDGLDVRRQRRAVQQRIGVQLQASTLPDLLRAGEALDLFASLYPGSLTRDGLLERLGLGERRRTYATDLSGGQQQRLSLALALVNDPKVLFLDEPTTGLDPQARRSVWELISEIRQDGKTVVLTTHYMEEAETLCDRIAIMDRGKIVALDTPRELIGQLTEEGSIECSLGDKLPTDVLDGLSGVVEQERLEQTVVLRSVDLNGTLVALLQLLTELGLPLNTLQVRTPTLEDVFLSLTGHRLRD